MDGVEIVAELMKVAAVTAPKSMGKDFIEVRITSANERASIAQEMLRIGAEKGTPNWDRDASGIENADGLLLLGLKKHPGIGLDCKSCGFESCKEFNAARRTDGDFEGPNCMLRLLDLGIALGSAAKTAQIHNVDNRIMYRVGVAARNIGLMPQSMIVMGIPLSVSAKNIYFDR